MHRLFSRRRGVMTLVATVAAAVVAAGVAYAATSGPSGTAKTAAGRIYACVTSRLRTLNLTSAGAMCPNGQRKISWNAAGARGQPGARGQSGAVGAAGSTGPQGPAGANGTGVLSGGGPPSAALGANGDFYIDTSANTLYGPKSGAGWGSAVSLVGPQGTQGATGSTGPAGPPGPTASAFSQNSTSLPSDGSTTTVVSFTIDPAFAGNLLVQASGFVSYGSTSAAFCRAFVDTSPIGLGIQATVTAAVTAEALSVTAAAAVTAGTHTVSIECSTVTTPTTPTVTLTAFALVAAS